MALQLSEIEVRILGALVEKELTTPEYYPLSLNALVNACNQKSNRDPVMNLNENAVSQALRSLGKEGLAGPTDAWDNRVSKFEPPRQEAFNLQRRDIARLENEVVALQKEVAELKQQFVAFQKQFD